jgi:hypothetical protein
MSEFEIHMGEKIATEVWWGTSKKETTCKA